MWPPGSLTVPGIRAADPALGRGVLLPGRYRRRSAGPGGVLRLAQAPLYGRRRRYNPRAGLWPGSAWFGAAAWRPGRCALAHQLPLAPQMRDIYGHVTPRFPAMDCRRPEPVLWAILVRRRAAAGGGSPATPSSPAWPGGAGHPARGAPEVWGLEHRADRLPRPWPSPASALPPQRGVGPRRAAPFCRNLQSEYTDKCADIAGPPLCAYCVPLTLVAGLWCLAKAPADKARCHALLPVGARRTRTAATSPARGFAGRKSGVHGELYLFGLQAVPGQARHAGRSQHPLADAAHSAFWCRQRRHHRLSARPPRAPGRLGLCRQPPDLTAGAGEHCPRPARRRDRRPLARYRAAERELLLHAPLLLSGHRRGGGAAQPRAGCAGDRHPLGAHGHSIDTGEHGLLRRSCRGRPAPAPGGGQWGALGALGHARR